MTDINKEQYLELSGHEMVFEENEMDKFLFYLTKKGEEQTL